MRTQDSTISSELDRNNWVRALIDHAIEYSRVMCAVLTSGSGEATAKDSSLLGSHQIIG